MLKADLPDHRFRLVDKWSLAKIYWLYAEYEEKAFLQWGFDESLHYVSWFKRDGAMCINNNLAHLVNTTLRAARQGQDDANKDCIPLTFDLETHLPCLMGEMLER